MSRPRHAFGQQPGRLVATMLRALAAELAEPGRYARGKAYARDGAVIDVDIRPGAVSGLVLGSRQDPYEARIVVDAAPADELERAGIAHAATMSLLIPGRDELAVSCTCPDAQGALCKHAVAVLLVFADETSIEPDLLVRWRTTDDDRDGLPRPDLQRLAPRGRAAGASSATTTSRRVPSAPAPAAARVDVLAGLLELGGELPTLPRLGPHRAPAPPPLALLDPVVQLTHQLTESAIDAVVAPHR